MVAWRIWTSNSPLKNLTSSDQSLCLVYSFISKSRCFLLLDYLNFYRYFMAHHLIFKGSDENRDICVCYMNGIFSAVTIDSYTFCKQDILQSLWFCFCVLQWPLWWKPEQFKQQVSGFLMYFNHTGWSIWYRWSLNIYVIG